MARAIAGDYDFGNLKDIPVGEMEKYKFIGALGKYTIYNLIGTYDYIVGYYSKGKTTFKIVAIIYFDKIESEKDLYEVDTIYVQRDKRGEGISTTLYSYFVKEHDYIILGSAMQRFGARKLWASLSRRLDLTVDIIDIKHDKVLEKDTVIRHGDSDEEFDERVWSYDNDKKHIRLVLSDIK